MSFPTPQGWALLPLVPRRHGQVVDVGAQRRVVHVRVGTDDVVEDQTGLRRSISGAPDVEQALRALLVDPRLLEDDLLGHK